MPRCFARTRASRLPRLLLAGAAAMALLSTASAHDEDWRKILDRRPSVFGPIVAPGDPSESVLIAPREPFGATGVSLLSQIPINNFAGSQRDANDCWGYTSPSGREYAIIGLEAGFGFVEVTNPTSPVVIATIPGPSSIWHDVKVIGPYAYGVSEGGAGVQVMDMRQIDAGVVTLVRNAEVGGHSTTHNLVSNEAAGTLYLAGANIGNGGLIRLDLTDPEQPQIAGGWTGMYVHDAHVVTWRHGPLAGREIAFCASGFNGGGTQTGLRVVDLTDPQNPVLLATLFYESAGYSHQVWVDEAQQYLYLNDELDEVNGLVSQTTTRIIDVSDPEAPELRGTFSSGRPAIDHNLYIHEGLVYQANYRSGLRVFETTDPLNPTETAFFDTDPTGDAPTFNSAWSVYPYFESGTVIVSDIERGLFVLDVNAAPPPIIRIQSLGPLPLVIDAEGGDTIDVVIDAIASTLDASTVELVITDAAGEQRVAGQPNGDGTFTFTLPPVLCDGDAAYAVEARTTDGDLFTLPSNAATNPFTAKPITSAQLAFADDFNASAGWSVSGNVSDGAWNRGVPVNAGRGDPPADADGSGSAYLTDNSAANSGNSDVDNGVTRLTSPAFDTTGGALISYAYWFDAFATPSFDDSLLVEVSTNNGATWTVAAEHATPATKWRDASFVIDAADASATTRVRFSASDIGDQNVIEAGVDAFRVDTLGCVAAQPCNAVDLAVPFGQLDAGDTIAFVSLANAGDPSADLDANGGFDAFDVLQYLAIFRTGCP